MPGTLDEVNCISPTPTMSSTGGDGLQDSRDFKDYNGLRSWSRNSRSSSALDRHSESSESLDNQSTSSGNGRQDFGSSEYIPTRSTKTAPKVAYNPMQFVKTGPTKLAQTAQEQLKKAEEVKKIREKKKDDAEDWQSNLEGWKSSRRKRQEHVIERVTEVKRMEQEEALKVSEAATKRLIGMREKRGKLSALYSVEDNDEIEFSPGNESTDAKSPDLDSSDSVFSDQKEEKQVKSEAVPITTSPDDPNSRRQPSPEYTYEKSIQDYVKYSNAALAKQEVTTETLNLTSLRKEEMKVTKSVETTIEKRADAHVVEQQQRSESAELVVKRRSVFERDGSTEAIDKAAVAVANRRSGEFSSTFKNRLSTFEMSETTTTTSRIIQPDRDPQFKNKLANFHKVATEAPANEIQQQQQQQQPEVKVPIVADQAEKPNFKAKLAAFRQVEEASKPVVAKPLESRPPPPKIELLKETPIQATKPTLPASKPTMTAVKSAPAVQPVRPKTQVPEPIYANSSVAMGSRATPPATTVYSPVHHPSAGDAESSDCTEDEGIRSLSPHGTPSPTSPTRTEPPEPLPPPLPSHPPVGYSPYSFQQQQQQQQQQQKEVLPNEPVAVIPESSSVSTAWPPAEVVWDDWVDLGAVQNAAPPSEKPPPPPPDEDILLHHSTTSTCTSSPTDAAPIQQVVTRRGGNERHGTDGGLRQELRKRRSDFLGFDVNAMEDDAKEMADAIPPPPDLKTLLRNATDYRAADLGLAEWQQPANNNNNEREEEQEESVLARKEREIIETLEKEEKERMRNAVAAASNAGHNRSHDGIEYEMTAEIDQLAREWKADTMLGPGWRSSSKFQAMTSTEESYRPAAVEPPEPANLTTPPLHIEVGHQNNNPASPAPASREPKQQPSPPKPSRLSAAPKPRLHDGEAWMAKRKVASEGGAGQRKDIKDVSRHWLIQEAEQRRIDAMQERNYSPSSTSTSSTQQQLTPPVRHPAPSSNNADGSHWMSRSSSSTSMDKMSELLRLPKDQSSRSTSSLGSSPTPRPLYANQEEILEYADFTGAPHTAPPVWQVRSLVSSGSMDQLQSIHSVPPSRPAKSQSQTLPSSAAMQQQYLQQSGSLNPAQIQPSWRSTHPPETEKEPIAPLPHSVIHTLTQRMTQRSNNNNNNNANYGDYMNVQEATGAGPVSRAGPQVPAQRPVNYRHPSLVGPSHSAPVQTNNSVQPQNNNDRMLSVSGKKKCSLCQEELGRGAAMIIESLRLFYHINCFRCCVCGIALGNGTAGTDVRVRNNNLHCHDCYSNDDGLKFSKV